MTKCFVIAPTDKLRRFVYRYHDGCPSMRNFIDEVDLPVGEDLDVTADLWKIPRDDLRWPQACTCGFVFNDNSKARCGTSADRLYKRQDSSEIFSLRDAQPGAMYDAWWYHDVPECCGPDGKSIAVVCPGGRTWHIDTRANNCTLPEDKVHKCWVRHGEMPNITVDKNGVTCSAGAGSILMPNYHGFLRNGEFT